MKYSLSKVAASEKSLQELRKKITSDSFSMWLISLVLAALALEIEIELVLALVIGS